MTLKNRNCKNCGVVLAKKIKPTSTGYCKLCRLKLAPPAKGSVRSDMVGNRKSARYGKDNPAWKGDKVGYVPLHIWVRRQLGTPTVCEHCGRGNLYGRSIHWANKSHKYLRNIADWLRLCARCHFQYDGKNFQKK